MAAIQPQQRNTIFAIGKTSLHLTDDELHILVAGVTGKESIKVLTYAEAAEVVTELKARQKAANATPRPTKKKHPSRPGYITSEQQKKVWALMYVLEKLSPAKGNASVGERLCGVIHKELGMNAKPETPFVWIDTEKGRQLIDALKRYVKNAESKVQQEGLVQDG